MASMRIYAESECLCQQVLPQKDLEESEDFSAFLCCDLKYSSLSLKICQDCVNHVELSFNKRLTSWWLKGNSKR